jgi:broad specificity phosphatase PhoE
MRTTLYLMRHGATEANLATPPRLQGRRHNAPLVPVGVRQAEATRDFLAVRPIDQCFSSPLLRALETAAIVSAPHGLVPTTLRGLIECDVGDWEGLDWQTIKSKFSDDYERYMADPSRFGYPGGESFAEVHDRAAAAVEDLFAQYAGQTILVVSHHIVNRTYLAGLLGLGVGNARQVTLDNCGISVVIREQGKTIVSTLNAAFHLQGVAA